MAGGTDKGYSLMKGQVVGLIFGLFIIAIVSVIDYHFICQFSIVYYIVGILLTLAVHTPLGTDNNTGTYRWIKLGPISFQPTELMKIILIITLATLFAALHSKLDKFSSVIKICIVAIVPIFAILTQPDLSSSLVGVFIMCIMIFIGGVTYRIIAAVLLAQDEQARTACCTADNRRGANRIGVQQEKRAARLGAGRAKRRRYIYNRGHRAPPCG